MHTIQSAEREEKYNCVCRFIFHMSSFLKRSWRRDETGIEMKITNRKIDLLMEVKLIVGDHTFGKLNLIKHEHTL